MLDSKQINEIEKSLNEIKSYKSGHVFTINYSSFPTKEVEQSMYFLLQKAVEFGYIESISLSQSFDDILGLSGRFCTSETFKRL